MCMFYALKWHQLETNLIKNLININIRSSSRIFLKNQDQNNKNYIFDVLLKLSI
jgi:hypothetical protein